MAHFAFIACGGGPLITLRRRQLLVLLCEKGRVKEASELLTSATASPAFNSQDLSTIVRNVENVLLCFYSMGTLLFFQVGQRIPVCRLFVINIIMVITHSSNFRLLFRHCMYVESSGSVSKKYYSRYSRIKRRSGIHGSKRWMGLRFGQKDSKRSKTGILYPPY